MKPVVAVTCWKRNSDTFLGPDTPVHTLMNDYAEALDSAGAVSLLVGRLNAADADAVLERVHGLVITGGGDIDPARYGAENTDSERIDPHADERDLALLVAANRRKMPVLGICRGLQATSVALGGALHQHVLSDGGADHPTLSDDAAIRNAGRHLVTFDPDSRLAAIYGATERKVNSLHHQAVSRVGDGMRPVAWASDGSIEAAEADSDWPLLAVQWHPEMMDDAAEDSLFEAFVSDARAYSAPRPTK